MAYIAPEVSIQKCSTLNLREFTTRISCQGMTLVMGPPGSGKSALIHYSLLAEADRRLDRYGDRRSAYLMNRRSGWPRPDPPGNDPPIIDPVVPMIDLNQRLDQLTADISVAEQLGLMPALSVIFAASGTLCCPKDKVLLRRRDLAQVSAAIADRLLAQARLGGQNGNGSGNDILRFTLILCRPLAAPDLIRPAKSGRSGLQTKPGRKSVERAVLQAFQAGARRFIVGNKYIRLKDESVDPLFEAWKRTPAADLQIIEDTIAVEAAADQENPAAGISAAVERAVQLGRRHQRLTVVPSGGSGSIDWDGRVEYNSAALFCPDCGFETTVSNLNSSGIEKEVNGQTLSSLLELPLGSPQLSSFLKSLTPEQAAQAAILPGLGAAASGQGHFFGKIKLSQKLSSLSATERLAIFLLSVSAMQPSGILFTLSHVLDRFNAEERSSVRTLLDRLAADGNGILLEERSPDLNGFVQPADQNAAVILGPGGGKRGGALVWRGLLTEVKRKSLAKPSSGIALLHKTIERHTVCILTRQGRLKAPIEIAPGEIVLISGASGTGKTSTIQRLLHGFNGLRRVAKGSSSRAADSPGNLDVYWEPAFVRSARLAGFAEQEGGKDPIRFGWRRSNRRLLSLLGIEQDLAGVFAGTSSARQAGLSPQSFLFSSAESRCAVCNGRSTVVSSIEPFGTLRHECFGCAGTGLGTAVLASEYRGVSYESVLLGESCDQLELFSSRREIVERLQLLIQAQFGYLPLSAAEDRFLESDAALFEIIDLAFKQSNPTANRRKRVVLFDHPISAADPAAGLLFGQLLRRIVGEDGIAFVTAPANVNGLEFTIEIAL